MGNYVLAQTGDTKDNGMPTEPGRINGGIYQRTDDPKLQNPSVVVGVDDIQEAIQAVKNAGGHVEGEPQEIPGVGTFVSIKDTEGNWVGVLQPTPMS